METGPGGEVMERLAPKLQTVGGSISFEHAADFYDSTRALPPDLAVALTAALLRAIERAGADRVLEVGVGTGRIARPLGERGVRVCGVDISPGMMRRLVEQIAPGALMPDLLLADATGLPFADGSFRVMMLCHVLHLIPRWQQAAAEIRRVLAPGGVFLHHGDQNAAPSDWDPAAAWWKDALQRRGFHRRPRPSPDEMAAGFRALGGSCAEETIAESTEISTAQEELDLVRNRTHSWSWEIPDEIFADCLSEFESWAPRQFGGLDARLERRVKYQLEVWRFK